MSSDVTKSACTDMNVVLETLPKGMPLIVVDRPPSGVFISMFG